MKNEKSTTENKNTLANGIYIPADLPSGELFTIEEWAKQSDPTVAKFVVLITDKCALTIAKNDLDGEFKFNDAQKAASAFGEAFGCPTRHEAIEMYDARFRGLDDALKLIGGMPLNENGWHWTSEADLDPECNSGSAFLYGGGSGSVSGYHKYDAYAVRPVSAFIK